MDLPAVAWDLPPSSSPSRISSWILTHVISPTSSVAPLVSMLVRTWVGFRTSKSAEISYATIQGRDALVQKFRDRSNVVLASCVLRPLAHGLPTPLNLLVANFGLPLPQRRMTTRMVSLRPRLHPMLRTLSLVPVSLPLVIFFCGCIRSLCDELIAKVAETPWRRSATRT
jgi:hypothetical protein